MTDIAVEKDKLVLSVKGMDKVWALKGRLEFPLQHVENVRHDPEIVKKQKKGLRLLGTHVRGLITAGTFRHNGERYFWNVRHPENALVIDLNNEPYSKLIVEVENPAQSVAKILEAKR